MKKGFLIVVLLLAVHEFLVAQKEIISTATELIVARKYDAANRYLDSVLKKDKKNVDALMMKGNVVLNRVMDTLPSAKFITEEDQSLFTSTISEKSKIIPEKTVLAVEKYWRQCLKLDSSRVDIRKGLCSIYSMALMKKELKEEMIRLMKAEADDGEQAFRMAEYARNFSERNRFDEAMDLYRFIAALYPKVAGIRADIASEYFYKGRINEALAWLDSCYNFNTVDETSFLNGAFIYSELGYFDDAQNVLNTYSSIFERKMDQFYHGLRQFADSSDKYLETFQEFLLTVDTNAYSTEVALARKLMVYRDIFSIDHYKELINDQDVPDYYKVLIYTRGLKQFGDRCETSVLYGLYQASKKNYSSAVQFLEDAESCEIKEREFATLVYAYTLFHLDKAKALQAFQELLYSSNSFYQQAAKYFGVAILKEQQRNEEAKKLMTEIITAPEKSKYRRISSAAYERYEVII